MPFGKDNMLTKFKVRFDILADGGLWTQVHYYSNDPRFKESGADITGNTATHSKEHMLAGEGSGHHSEVQQNITGYDTVDHPEVGYWETRVVGGHWE